MLLDIFCSFCSYIYWIINIELDGMKNKELRFSVVIPAFNEADYLSQTLESLLVQDFQGNYEIIVVDNNSTDATAVIAKSYGARVVSEKHRGVCWARQKGTEVAKGEIVVSTDADTTFSKSWLSKIDQSFDREGVVAVAGPCRFVDPPYWGAIYPYFLFGFVSKFSRLTGRPFYITATNTAFKKTAWSGYNTKITQGGDELDLLRSLKKRGKVVFDNSNPTHTSSRRLQRGLFYNLFVTLIYYYILEYYVNRIFNAQLIGSAPNIRETIHAKLQEFNNQ
jgi:glycosyltransferase involved in cell wall biosynthesis